LSLIDGKIFEAKQTSEETAKGEASTSQMSSSEPPEKSSLDINCEDAIVYVINHVQSQNIPHVNLDFASLSNSTFLDKVSEMLLTPALTECIAIAFYPLLPDLVGRWAFLSDKRPERIACALGRLIHLEPKLKRYLRPL
jgi:hypothetical protein